MVVGEVFRFHQIWSLQMGMRLIYLLLVGGVCALPAGYSPEEAIKTEFELTLYDLQDDFDRWTEAVKEAYLKHRFEKKVFIALAFFEMKIKTCQSSSNNIEHNDFFCFTLLHHFRSAALNFTSGV